MSARVTDSRLAVGSNALGLRTLARTLAMLLACTGLVGCYEYHHYTDDPADLDGLFFGSIDDEGSGEPDGGPEAGFAAAQEWQTFYLWGLTPWERETPTYAIDQLAAFKSNDPNPQRFTIETRKSFWNVVAEAGLGLVPIVGFVQPFFLNWRSIEVRARGR